MPRRTTEAGFALIAAALLIVFVGMVGVFLAYLVGAGTQAGAEETLASQALYAAESGLERGARILLSPTLSERVACNAITGTADLTNKSIASNAGVFTLTGGAPDYATTAATLNGAITATDTTIPFTSGAAAPTYGMAASGRAMIDGEAIAYTGIGTNVAVCGTAPCLVGVHRALSGTAAVAHASGAPVGQYQCAITAEGGAPDIATSTSSKRTLSEGVALQDGWVVGARSSGGNTGWLFMRWNDRNNPNTWFRPTVNPLTGAQQLNAVSMLSYTDGWAVGNNSGGGTENLFRWSAAADTWTRFPFAGGTYDLYGVHTVSSTDAWAVGQLRANNGAGWNVLHWNGSAWTQFGINTGGGAANRARTLYGVTVNDTNGDGVGDDGWAVGANARFLHYQSPAWTRDTSLAWPYNTQTYYAATCVSVSDCFAVGGGEAIAHWDGTQWTGQNYAFGVGVPTLYGVACADTSNCWAVGTNGYVFQYNAVSGTWTPQASGTTATLHAVSCINGQDCWAVGDVNGTMIHWDGSAWSLGPQSGTQTLYGISLVGAKERPQGAWREVFP